MILNHNPNPQGTNMHKNMSKNLILTAILTLTPGGIP